MNKSIFKKWWFWVSVVVLLGLFNAAFGDNENKTADTNTPAVTQEASTPVTEPAVAEAEKSKEPSEEEWQESYREIALSEASAYIELTVKGTITPENHESRTGVLVQYSEKITGEDQEQFKELANAVKSDNLQEAKRLYTLLGGKNFEELNEEPKAAKAEEKKTTQENSKPGDIGMAPEKFRKEFNSSAKSMGATLKIADSKIQNGSVQDVFSAQLNDNIYLQGSINKSDGSLRDMTMIARGDGSEESAANMLFTMGLIISVTSPDLSADERGNILRDVGLMGKIDFSNHNKSTERGAIKYTLITSDQIGIMFIAADVNDK
ncbi:hypothetical protein D3C74_56880 [compost metagenome]